LVEQRDGKPFSREPSNDNVADDTPADTHHPVQNLPKLPKASSVADADKRTSKKVLPGPESFVPDQPFMTRNFVKHMPLFPFRNNFGNDPFFVRYPFMTRE
jgi:hypothetical protein